jgi:hypothetical protein
MNDDDPSASAARAESIRGRMAALRQEHQDLDASIEALTTVPLPDQLMLARLKRKKLALRDEIVQLEDQILPDIIA